MFSRTYLCVFIVFPPTFFLSFLFSYRRWDFSHHFSVPQISLEYPRAISAKRMTETKSCERLRLYIYIYVYVYSSLIRNLSNDIFFRVYLATLPCIDQNLYSSLLNAPFSPKETEPVCLPRREKNRTFRT